MTFSLHTLYIMFSLGFLQAKWNPTQGLYLMTATNDDLNPVLKLWDLRRSTTAPLTEFGCHSKAVKIFGWCTFDDMIVSSYGKDEKFLLWDLYFGKAVMDLNDPTGESSIEAESAKLNESFHGMGLSGVAAANTTGLAGLGFGESGAETAGDVFNTFNRTTPGALSKDAVSQFLLFSPCLKSMLLAGNLSEKAAGSKSELGLSFYTINSYGSINYQAKFDLDIDVTGNM